MHYQSTSCYRYGQILGISSVINVEEDTIGMGSQNQRPLMSQLSLDDFVPPAPKPRKCTMSSPPSVKLSLSSTAKSHSYCFLSKRLAPMLVNVPPKARFSSFLHSEIIIPAGSRCCPVYLHEDLFTDEAISSVRCTNDHITLNRTSILNLLKNLKIAALHNETTRINFDDKNS